MGWAIVLALMAALVGCAGRPTAMPRATAVKALFYNDTPDGYEPTSLTVKLDDRVVSSPADASTFKSLGAFFWSGHVDAGVHDLFFTADFRRANGSTTTVVGGRRISSVRSTAVISFFERPPRDGKPPGLDAASLRPTLFSPKCGKLADGPAIHHSFKLIERTSTAFALTHIQISVDGVPLVEDEARIVAALKANQVPIFAREMKVGCHEVTMTATLVGGAKLGLPSDRELVVSGSSSFRAVDGAALQIILIEQASEVVEERPTVHFHFGHSPLP